MYLRQQISELNTYLATLVEYRKISNSLNVDSRIVDVMDKLDELFIKVTNPKNTYSEQPNTGIKQEDEGQPANIDNFHNNRMPRKPGRYGRQIGKYDGERLTPKPDDSFIKSQSLVGQSGGHTK